MYLNEILNIINCLSINLQSTTLDIKRCTFLNYATKQQILELRNDEKFFELYEQSLVIAQNSKIPTPSNDNLSSNRTRQNSSTLADYYITMATGKRMAYSSEDMKTEQKKNIF